MRAEGEGARVQLACTGFSSVARRSPWVVLLIGAFSAVLLCAPGFAQEVKGAPDGTPAAPETPSTPAEAARKSDLDQAQGHYISTSWLVFLGIVLAFWIATWSLINADAPTARMKHLQWNTFVFLVGMGGMLLTTLVHGTFMILTLVGLAATAAAYVIRRNSIVQKEARIFTPRHLNYVLRRVVAKFGIRIKAKAPERAAGLQVDAQGAKIVLVRKDGQVLETIETDPRTIQSPSEAMLAIKQVVESAVHARATDIHIEPTAEALNIRFRVDGILHPLPPYPGALGAPMVSVIKVLADMDIAEKRKPQDGTFAGQLEGKNLDFRVASSGTVHGETMAIRILDRDRDLITLDKLGMPPKVGARFQEFINAPHGMVIVGGPTGAGKTTTLYAALLEMDAFQKNIMTIEDPIEYSLENIQQMAVNPKAGITFPSALRSVLRQDPNVIMVGEVRDAETARVAMQAAMTGHLVLTTLHANDSIICLLRLLDLGVEPYLMASSVTCIVAQRLVRVLCQQCRVPYQPKPDFLKKVGLPADKPHYFYKAQGCQICQGTGYYGRTGTFEMLVMSDSIRELAREKLNIKSIREEARKNKMRTIQDDGMSKVVQGITSLKELLRVTK